MFDPERTRAILGWLLLAAASVLPPTVGCSSSHECLEAEGRCIHPPKSAAGGEDGASGEVAASAGGGEDVLPGFAFGGEKPVGDGWFGGAHSTDDPPLQGGSGSNVVDSPGASAGADGETVACGRNLPFPECPLVIGIPVGGGGAPTAMTPPATESDTTLLLIDDFEDGDKSSNPVLGGYGSWMIRGGSFQYPGSCTKPTALEGELSGSNWSMLTYGCGNRTWSAALLLQLWVGLDPLTPLDASDYAGVRFKARGQNPFRFTVSTIRDSEAPCSAPCGSFDVDIVPNVFWATYEVPFSALLPRDETVDLDPSRIFGLEWVMLAETFEVLIDDVAFYRP
jgi:hypothetical protein